MIDYQAAASNPWPNTIPRLELVCEVRAPDPSGRVHYGANEFIQDGKVCRHVLVYPAPKS